VIYKPALLGLSYGRAERRERSDVSGCTHWQTLSYRPLTAQDPVAQLQVFLVLLKGGRDREQCENRDHNYHLSLTHLSVADCIIFDDSVNWRKDMDKEVLESVWVHV